MIRLASCQSFKYVVLMEIAKLQPKGGVEAGPQAMIDHGIIQQLEEELEFNVHYDGQVYTYTDLVPSSDPDYRGMKKPKLVSAVTQRLSEQVYAHAKEGKLVLTLGGDHSIAIGTVSGTARAIRERLGREIAVIWVDAHADINTPETSDSGNIHGMPVAFLTGLATEKREDIFGWLQDHHRLSTRKLVYIGLRDIDRGEKRILREHGIKAFSMHDIDRYVPFSVSLFRPFSPLPLLHLQIHQKELIIKERKQIHISPMQYLLIHVSIATALVKSWTWH